MTTQATSGSYRRDLGALTRAKGLEGALPRLVEPLPPTEVAPVTPLAEEPPAGPEPEAAAAPVEPEATTATEPTSPLPKPKRQGTSKSQPEIEKAKRLPKQRGFKHIVVVHLPVDLKGRLKEAAERQGLSYADYFLAAFDALYGDLPVLFPPPAERTSPLPPRGRRQQPSGVGTTTIQLQLTTEELEVVEARRTELRVNSRSAFVTKTLETYFDRRATPQLPLQ